MMCTNRIHIKSYGQDLYLDCGSCPSCLAKKASANCRKINNDYDPTFNYYFVTFTYDNIHVPFIKLPDKSDLKKFHHSFDIDVYRGSKSELVTLDEPLYKSDYLSVYDKKYFLRNFPLDYCVGVLIWSDLTNFFKRLRSYFVKLYGKNSFKFSYFAVSELGETFFRPHFHVLFKTHILEDVFSLACRSCWSMCDWDKVPRAFERAINPASYLSLYLASNNDLPSFYKISAFAPKKSHSLFFGQSIDDFSLSSVFRAAEKHNLTYYAPSLRKSGITLYDYVPYPKYIISRYFPSFKGISKLSYTEFLFLVSNVGGFGKGNQFYEHFYPPKDKKELLNPRSLRVFCIDRRLFDLAVKLRLFTSDIKKLYNAVWRAITFAYILGVSPDYYFHVWYHVPIITFSQSLKKLHFGLQMDDYYKFYFNIHQFVNNQVRAPTLQYLLDTFDDFSSSDVSKFDIDKDFISKLKLSKFNKNKKQKTHLL